MKKAFSLLVTIGCIITFPFHTNALSRDEVPGKSVYGSVSEQDEVYGIIQQSENFVSWLTHDGTSIMKESITPVYTADFLQYAETGVFEIAPDIEETLERGKLSGAKRYYRAKAVTKFGFAGNYSFYTEDGIAYPTGFHPSALLEPGNTSIVSHYYADHANRITRLVGREISESDVRYVGVDHLGMVFYINDGELEALIVISADGAIFDGGKGEMASIDGELKKKADERLAEHKEELALEEEWKAAHPNEAFSFYGGGMASHYMVNPADVDDVYTLPEPLANVGENAPPQALGGSEPTPSELLSTVPDNPPEEGGGSGMVIGLIALAAIPITVVSVVLLKRK